jgi:hypothetical protein
MVVPAPERDVRGGVLVDERVVKDAPERADSPTAVHERDLSEPRCTLVLSRDGSKRVGTLVGVDPDRDAAFELDPDAGDDRAGELERHGRRHVAVHALGIRCREQLLGREVR